MWAFWCVKNAVYKYYSMWDDQKLDSTTITMTDEKSHLISTKKRSRKRYKKKVKSKNKYLKTLKKFEIPPTIFYTSSWTESKNYCIFFSQSENEIISGFMCRGRLGIWFFYYHELCNMYQNGCVLYL